MTCNFPQNQAFVNGDGKFAVIFVSMLTGSHRRIESSDSRFEAIAEWITRPPSFVGIFSMIHGIRDAGGGIVVRNDNDGTVTAGALPEPNDIEFHDPRGSGLKGNVFRATQRSLNRLVAVKFIKPEWGGDALRHAQSMARISGHDNVIAVHFVAKISNPLTGQVCNAMVMEWIEGETLAKLLEGPLFDVIVAKEICLGIVAGLKHIHQAGIAHSDLHAGNILVAAGHKAKIIDADEDRMPSFAQLSYKSVEQAKCNDVDYCRHNLTQVYLHSNAKHETRFREELYKASSLDEIEQVLEWAFDPSSVVNGPSVETLNFDSIRCSAEERIRNGNFWNLIKRKAAIVVGIAPSTKAILSHSDMAAKHLPPLSGSGWNQLRRAESVASIAGEDSDISGVVEISSNGAIVAADTWVLDPAYHPEKHLIIQSSATCSKIIKGLTKYHEILLSLGLHPPFHVFVTLLDVVDYRLLVSNTEWSVGVSPTRDLRPPQVVIAESTPITREQMAWHVKPILDFVWQEFGFAGCDKYTQSGVYNGRELFY